MARAARKDGAAKPAASVAVPAAPKQARPKAGQASPVQLDKLIHERVRLAIVSALAGVDAMSFNELKALLGITDGNLSVHARKLEEAGVIACRKTFVERVPHTAFRLTPAGRKALDAYLAHMEALIRRVRTP